MVDISAIAGLLSALKSSRDLVDGIVEARDEHQRRAASADLLKRLIDAYQAAAAAQDELATLKDRLRDLEREKLEAENWSAKLARYEMITLREGNIVYAVKEAQRGTEPFHHICPGCAERKKKSILQPVPGGYGTTNLKCFVCGFEVAFAYKSNWGL